MPRTVSPPDWIVREPDWQPERNAVWESLLTVGNGYLGVRGFPAEPFEAGPTIPGVYVAGVFNRAPGGIPEIPAVTNCFAAEVLLEGRPVTLERDRLRSYRRELDLRRGLAQREFVFADAGRTTRIAFERFASLVNPHLAGQSLRVTPLDWAGQVTVRLWAVAPVGPDEAHLRLLHAQHLGRDRLLLATRTTGSHIRLGHACRCRAWVRQSAPPRPRHLAPDGRRWGFEYRQHLECDQRAIFDRTVATYASRDPETTSVERCCLEDVRPLNGGGYGVHRRRHVRAWKRRWDRVDVALEGPVEDQRALRFAIFHLIQACPQRDPGVSIAAKGLTGPGYRGHVFWDTEVFMLPFFVATDPSAARRLIEYRLETLEGARRKAAAAGYDGAMFAWESTDTGDETCPPTVPDPKTGEPVRVLTGELQHHISADVVWGAWAYAAASADVRFRERQLLVLAVETARFWAGRAAFDPDTGCYHIREVIGPDEYHEQVDDSAYTNAMAAWNLDVAANEVARMRAVHPRSHLLRWLNVEDEEMATWRAIAANLRRPQPRQDGVIEQFDGFFDLRQVDVGPLSSRVSTEPEKVRMARIHRAQVLKQADVLMLMMLFPDAFPDPVKRANWDYYEPRTTHDSSLSPSVHAVVAADLGRAPRAYDYFRRSAFLDLTNEMGNTDQGLHLAAMGGTWQAAVRGLLGLRLDGDAPEAHPALPPEWSRVVTRVWHRKRLYRVEATHEGTRVEPE